MWIRGSLRRPCLPNSLATRHFGRLSRTCYRSARRRSSDRCGCRKGSNPNAVRGVSEKVIRVVPGGELCGLPFSKGIEYLVYGRRLLNGDVNVGASSTAKLKKEAAKDLEYLRGLANARHGTTIYGRSRRYAAPDNPRAMMRSCGYGQQDYNSRTVHLSPPAQSMTADVPDKACAQFNFWLDPFAKKN